MVDRKLQKYDSKYDWVKVKSNRKHNLGKREWNNQTNVPIKKGEELILPRGSSDPNENLSGMKFYFKNGFYEVIDSDPELPEPEKASTKEVFECSECERSFDSERGLNQHKRQTHEKEEDAEGNKNEEEE